jgi:hypothetical protein
MNNEEFLQLLNKIGACHEAVEWIGKRDLQTAWNECQHGSWMLWLLDVMRSALNPDNSSWPSYIMVRDVMKECDDKLVIKADRARTRGIMIDMQKEIAEVIRKRIPIPYCKKDINDLSQEKR